MTIQATWISGTHIINTAATKRQAWQEGPPGTNRIPSRHSSWLRSSMVRGEIETYLQPIFPRALVRQRNTISRGCGSCCLACCLRFCYGSLGGRAKRRIALGACGEECRIGFLGPAGNLRRGSRCPDSGPVGHSTPPTRLRMSLDAFMQDSY